MCVWTAQAWSNCMYSLLEKRSKKDLKSVVVLTFLETLCKDGRSGLQGVPKGCQRSGPVGPNVGLAMPKRCPKVPKGAQRVLKGWPRVPTWGPKECEVAAIKRAQHLCHHYSCIVAALWLGGKTLGGCLPDVSQMSPRCLPGDSRRPPRCLPEIAKRTLFGVSRWCHLVGGTQLGTFVHQP